MVIRRKQTEQELGHYQEPGEGYEELSEEEIDEFVDDYLIDDQERKKHSGFRRFIRAVITLAAFVFFGVLAFYAYEFGIIPRDPSQLPVISADEAPFRVKPDEPGGMEVPNQDKTVYGAMQGDQTPPPVEQVLPAPEEPVSVDTIENQEKKPEDASKKEGLQKELGALEDGWKDQGTLKDDELSPLDELSAEPTDLAPLGKDDEDIEVVGTPPAAVPAIPSPAPVVTPAAPAPKAEKPKTAEAVKPKAAEVKKATSEKAAPAPKVAEASKPAPAPVPAKQEATSSMEYLRQQEEALKAKEATAAPVKQASTVPSAQERMAEELPMKPLVQADVTKVEKPTKPLSGAATGAYRVQLGAFKSEPEAKEQWQQIVKRNTSLLQNLTVSMERADLKEKGIFYRLKAGPFASRSEAQVVCDALIKTGQGCFVAK
ncbi:MAG: Periplasmic protein TonB, links inner and outer rane [Rickettsiales bacterium]|jgi:hypothetical protein|nr:Periplasmic protein TonB, links inner and outer rane [Rickettsiales bacterium]